ncbi:MAG: glycosyltransferase family 4 protein [Ferruginibacter sp.]
MKVLLIENGGRDFYISRLAYAHFLIKKGYKVYALIPADGYVERIKQSGIEVISYPFDRKNKGILQIIKLIFFYRKEIRKNNIDIIHSFRFQPNLINTLSNLFSKRQVVLHITGLGITFSVKTLKYRFLKWTSKLLYFFQFLRADTIIVQNPDDINDFLGKRLFKKTIHLIKGSGVNTNVFCPLIDGQKRISNGFPRLKFICVSRLLWEKGIKELTDAFSQLPKDIQKKVELNIVGWPDADNPRRVSHDFINSFTGNETIFFSGKSENVASLLQHSDVFIYPSYYREGIPRSVLEAMAVGMPIITTDIPGCNLTTINGYNGFLIEPQSIDTIKQAIIQTVNNTVHLDAMGNNSRNKAIKEFSNPVIFNEIVALYKGHSKPHNISLNIM